MAIILLFFFLIKNYQGPRKGLKRVLIYLLLLLSSSLSIYPYSCNSQHPKEQGMKEDSLPMKPPDFYCQWVMLIQGKYLSSGILSDDLCIFDQHLKILTQIKTLYLTSGTRHYCIESSSHFPGICLREEIGVILFREIRFKLFDRSRCQSPMFDH